MDTDPQHFTLDWNYLDTDPLENFNVIVEKCIINAYGNRILELGRHIRKTIQYSKKIYFFNSLKDLKP